MKECIAKLRIDFREKDMLEDEVVGEVGEDFMFSWNVEQILDRLGKMLEED